MNTHDIDIELPPLPEPGEAMSKWAYDESDMQDYARAAIEADRKRRGEPVNVNWVQGGIADFIADNWPDRKHTLQEIETGIRAIEIRPPQPAEPVTIAETVPSDYSERRNGVYISKSDLLYILCELRDASLYRAAQIVADALNTTPQPAEPVKVPNKEQLKVLAAHHCLVATKPDGEWRFEFNVDQLAGFIQELFERYTPRENGT